MQAPFVGHIAQLGQTSHGAVVVHYLHQHTHRLQTGQAAEVHGGLGVSGALEHALVLCVQGVYVARTAEGLGDACGVGKGTQGGAAVLSGDSSGAALQLVHRDGERRAEHGGVFLHLACEVQFLATLYGHGRAKDATGILEHEIHLLGCYFLGGDDDVALVLAVFVINNNHHLAGGKVGNGVFYSVECYLIHCHELCLLLLCYCRRGPSPCYPLRDSG